jgi:hypothetical protein
VLTGLGLVAKFSQHDQAPISGGYRTASRLDASLGRAITALEGMFTLDPDYAFRNGVISGSNQGLAVQVTALPLPGSGSGSSVTIRGTFGPTPLALSADIPSGGPGNVVGTVDARKVRFDVTDGPANTGESFRNLRVTGNYSGPTDLFALIIGGITYFGA